MDCRKCHRIEVNIYLGTIVRERSYAGAEYRNSAFLYLSKA